MLTLDNIKALIQDMYSADIPVYNAGRGDYYPYDFVRYTVTSGTEEEEKIFVCIKFNGAYDPTNTEYWREATEEDWFNAHLYGYTRDGIAKVVNNLVAQKTNKKVTKSLFEHKFLFDGMGMRTQTIQNEDVFVGWEIESQKGVGVTTHIHKIGLQFVDGEGDVELRCCHSSNTDEPYYTKTVHIQNTARMQWFVLDWYLPYVSDETNAGGRWFIGYNQAELPSQSMEAVNIGKDFSANPCPSCNHVNFAEWHMMGKYVRLSPFEVIDDRVVYQPKKNWGINLELSVECDLTNFIIAQRDIFARAIQLQVAYDVLKAFLYNANVNVERNILNMTKEQLIQELDGNIYTHSVGLLGQLNEAVKELDINTTGLDSVCLPCKTKGVKYGVA